MPRHVRCGWLVCLMLSASLNAVAQQPKVIATAIEELGDLDFDKRASAEQRLEKLGERASAALIDAMAKHKDIEVRLRAKQVLTRIYEAKVSRLIKVLGGNDPVASVGAEQDLRKCVMESKIEIEQEAARSALVRASIKHDAPAVRRTADRILAKAFTEVDALIAKLGDDSFEIRQRASTELLKIGTPALPALRKALNQPDIEIRNGARRAIEAITKEGR